MRVLVAGLGLVGGSLLRRLRDTVDVTGHDVDPKVRRSVASTGAAVTDSLEAGLAAADLVVLAAPVGANDVLLARLAAAGFGGVVTDVGSVKTPIVAARERVAPSVRLVAGHPMAGAETAGWEAADAGLFERARWVLCPPTGAGLRDWVEVARLVLTTGAVVVPESAGGHDRAVATISHLPHVLAAALAGRVDGEVGIQQVLAAGSFRDMTRVCRSPPRRTAEFCFANRDELIAALRQLRGELLAVEHLLAADDAAGFAAVLGRGHSSRARLDQTTVEPREVSELTHDVDDPATAARLVELGRSGAWLTEVSLAGSTMTASWALATRTPSA